MNSKNLEGKFRVSTYIVIYKFILGILELLLGIGIAIFGKQLFVVYQAFKYQELLEDPHDLLVHFSERILPYLFLHRFYVILILVTLGLVKIIGAIGLYYQKHWGQDLLVALTLVLLPFDLYALIASPSFTKFGYFVVNLLIALFLVNFKPREYATLLRKRIKRRP